MQRRLCCVLPKGFKQPVWLNQQKRPPGADPGSGHEEEAALLTPDVNFLNSQKGNFYLGGGNLGPSGSATVDMGS